MKPCRPGGRWVGPAAAEDSTRRPGDSPGGLTLTGWRWGAAWGQQCRRRESRGNVALGAAHGATGSGCPQLPPGPPAVRQHGLNCRVRPSRPRHPGQAVSPRESCSVITAVPVLEAPHIYSILCVPDSDLHAKSVSFLGAAQPLTFCHTPAPDTGPGAQGDDQQVWTAALDAGS